MFQCSSASRKFLNVGGRRDRRERVAVSVLFSEPKIPQTAGKRCGGGVGQGFSALQRAENSSTVPNSRRNYCTHRRFSALQRAENSSTAISPASLSSSDVSVLFSEPKIPQFIDLVNRFVQLESFSALQRAENSSMGRTSSNAGCERRSFSALQRAENSSIIKRASQYVRPDRFQCSSASRKFLNLNRNPNRKPLTNVSVLFSEPKIPQ